MSGVVADVHGVTKDSTQFTRRVFAVVRQIPHGRVSTYGDVATMAGSPLACRAVGSIMRACTIPGVPCHRVVAAGGHLGGYSHRILKRELLRAEGINVRGDRLQRFVDLRWRRI